MSRNSVAAVASALVICAAAGPGFAASTASATLGPLKIELIDIDPLDGISPSISFSLLENKTYAEVSRFPPSVIDSQSILGVEPWGASSVAAGLAMTHAAASIAGLGTAAGTRFYASGSDIFVNDPQFSSSSYFAFAEINNTFRLSPGTAVIVTAVGSIVAETSFGDAPEASNNVSLLASLLMTTPAIINGPGGPLQTSYDLLTLDSCCMQGPFSHSLNRRLGVSIVNAGDVELEGRLDFTVAVGGSLQVTPAVPEGSMPALMLAGIAAIACWRRAAGELSPSPENA